MTYDIERGNILVLDTTCSSKRNWPKRADIRLDISPDAKPDVLCDNSKLPFRDCVFDELYCDPPHAIGSSYSKLFARNPWMARFSFWKNKQELLDWLSDINVEFARIMKYNGKLFFKSSNSNKSSGMLDYHWVINSLSNFELMQDLKIQSKSFMANIIFKQHNIRTYTHYMTFRRL